MPLPKVDQEDSYLHADTFVVTGTGSIILVAVGKVGYGRPRARGRPRGGDSQGSSGQSARVAGLCTGGRVAWLTGANRVWQHNVPVQCLHNVPVGHGGEYAEATLPCMP